MGNLYTGDAILKGNLKVESDKPLDSGSVVQSKQELTTISNNLYNGKLVASVDDKAIFMLVDKQNASSLSDGWVKVAAIGTSDGSTSGDNQGGDSEDNEGNQGGSTSFEKDANNIPLIRFSELDNWLSSLDNETLINISNGVSKSLQALVGNDQNYIIGKVYQFHTGIGDKTQVLMTRCSDLEDVNSKNSSDGFFIYYRTSEGFPTTVWSEWNAFGGTPIENPDVTITEEMIEDISERVYNKVYERIKDILPSNPSTPDTSDINGSERFEGFTEQTPVSKKCTTNTGAVVFSNATGKFCYRDFPSTDRPIDPGPVSPIAATQSAYDDDFVQPGIETKYEYYEDWEGSDKYHSASNDGGLDKIYIYDSKLYVFNSEGNLVLASSTIIIESGSNDNSDDDKNDTDITEYVTNIVNELLDSKVIARSGTERFYGFTDEEPLQLSASVTTEGKVYFNTRTNKFCFGIPETSGSFIRVKYYSNWEGANRYHSEVNPNGLDKVYIYDGNGRLYTFDSEGNFATNDTGSGGGDYNITIDDEVTEESNNPVKSSGIFSAIKNTVDAKFLVLSEQDYQNLNPKDPNTFYFITK